MSYAWLWFLVHVMGHLPRRALYVAADLGATLAWVASPGIRRVTTDHMRHVLGAGSSRREQHRAARGCVRATGRYWADFCRGPHLPPDALFDELESVEGLSNLFEAYDRGCGVIAYSAHLGNPEYVVRAAARVGLNPLVLTEELSPPKVNALVHEARSTPGTRFLPVGLSAVREAIAQLRGGGVLAILGDRDILANGHPTAFFGERASLPTGAVDLALRTGAPILPMFVVRTRSGFAVYMEPAFTLVRSEDRAADLDAGMRRVAAALEAGIRRAPDQWFPLQPIWSGLAR